MKGFDIEGKPKRYALSFNRCPIHKDCTSISLDNQGSGTRLTNGKCCGQWRSEKAFPMRMSDLREIVTACECAIEDLEAAEEAAPEERT